MSISNYRTSSGLINPIMKNRLKLLLSIKDSQGVSIVSKKVLINTNGSNNFGDLLEVIKSKQYLEIKDYSVFTQEIAYDGYLLDEKELLEDFLEGDAQLEISYSEKKEKIGHDFDYLGKRQNTLSNADTYELIKNPNPIYTYSNCVFLGSEQIGRAHV